MVFLACWRALGHTWPRSGAATCIRRRYRSAAHRFAISRVMRSADTVLSTSWVMQKHGAKICRRPIGVVAFGIDTERFSPPPVRADKDGIVVGTVKSLEDKYGIDVLIEAFAIAQSRFAGGQLRLLIAGGGSRRKALENLAQRLGIGSSVTFTGTIEYGSVHRRYIRHWTSRCFRPLRTARALVCRWWKHRLVHVL